MPQAIGTAVISALLGAGAATGVAVAAGVVAVAATYAAGAYLLNKAAAALMPKPPKGKGGGLELNYAGTGERRRLVYGTVQIGGMQTIPPICSGNDGKLLHLVLTLAGHEVDDITDVYFDLDQITDAQIGAVTGTDADGVVGGGNKYADKAWIRRYLGTASQTVDYILSQVDPTHFTSDFRGRGVAYLALRLRYGEVFPGLPNVTAVVKGKKCYDPRSATTAWTSNPAVIARDYLVSSGETDIDEASVIAAANVCDQTVSVPPGATQKRYQFNGALLAPATPQEFEENLHEIIDSMRGRVVKRDGTWYVYAGTWDVPGVTIGTADWIGPVSVRPSASPGERWNAVRVWYSDAARAYQRVECFPRRNTAYETADGGDRIWLELELPGVTNEYEAQRHGEFALRASRNQLTMTGRLRPEFFKLATWDTVSVTDADYGFSAKTFRVAAMDLTPMGEVDVTLVEEGSSLWTDLAEGDYNAVSIAAGPDPGGSLPETRTGLVVTPDFASIGFRWNALTEPMPREQTRLIEKDTQGSPWLGTEAWRGDSTGVILGKSDTTTRYYWIQGIVGSYAGMYTPGVDSGYPAASDPLSYSAVSAVLEPSHIALPADVNGTVSDYTAAAGIVRITHGTAAVTSLATYSVGSAAGVSGTVNSADNLPWSGQPKGAYRVTACTSDIGVLWINAVYSYWYGPTPYLLPFTVIKQRVGATGADGAVGPPGTNIVVNGMMDVASSNGILQGWLALSAATSGYSGGRCLVLPDSASAYLSITHTEYITVDPLQENLGVSVKVRQGSAGARLLYVGFACYDEYFSYLGYERESYRAWLRAYNDSSSAGIRVFKPSALDGQFPGYVPTTAYNALIFTHSPVVASSRYSHINSFNLYPGRLYSSVFAGYDTSQSSYDTITVSSLPPVTVQSGSVIGLGELGSTHKYAYADYPSADRWDTLNYMVAGTVNVNARLVSAAEKYSFRHNTRYVRPFLYAVVSTGGNCPVYVDDFIVWRVPRVENPLIGDSKLESSGRIYHLGGTDIRSLSNFAPLPIQYNPTSGAVGDGAILWTSQSSRGGAWDAFLGTTLQTQKPRDAYTPFSVSAAGVTYKLSFKLYRSAANLGGYISVFIGNDETAATFALTEYTAGQWTYVERLVRPEALFYGSSAIRFYTDAFSAVNGGYALVSGIELTELAGGGATWQKEIASGSTYDIVQEDNTRRVVISTALTVRVQTYNLGEGAYQMHIGSWLELYNNTASAISITTNGTLRLAGTATTGTRTLAGYGLAVLNKVALREWTIYGPGVT